MSVWVKYCHNPFNRHGGISVSHKYELHTGAKENIKEPGFVLWEPYLHFGTAIMSVAKFSGRCCDKCVF